MQAKAELDQKSHVAIQALRHRNPPRHLWPWPLEALSVHQSRPLRRPRFRGARRSGPTAEPAGWDRGRERPADVLLLEQRFQQVLLQRRRRWRGVLRGQRRDWFETVTKFSEKIKCALKFKNWWPGAKNRNQATKARKDIGYLRSRPAIGQTRCLRYALRQPDHRAPRVEDQSGRAARNLKFRVADCGNGTSD